MTIDNSQTPSVPSNDEIREILVKRIDQQKQSVGIVVGVIEPAGRRVVAYGSLAKEDARTLDGDTIFEIGSVTKVFTSLLLADMVNRNEVALDDPASQYLPEHVKMPQRNGKPITLHDLSTHTSGLPSVPGNMKPKDLRNPYADYSAEDLYQFLSSYELPREPGTKFEYSNLGAGLLGHLLATRAGTDYESLIRTRITEPLGMSDTAITLSPSKQQRMATGHTGMLGPTVNWDLPTLAGAGAFRSSANDMLTFLDAFISELPAKAHKESPLAPAMRAMLEVRRPMGDGKDERAKNEIGLGWILMKAHDREIAMHDGGTGGFRSWLGFDPKERTGVVVLSNAGTPIGVFDLGIHLLDQKWPLATIEPPKQRTEIQIDAKLLDNYTGRYQVNPNLTFEITRDEGQLFAQGFAKLGSEPVALPKFKLLAESEKTFFAKVSDSQITFETGSDGQATSLILHKAGRDMPAPRLP